MVFTKNQKRHLNYFSLFFSTQYIEFTTRHIEFITRYVKLIIQYIEVTTRYIEFTSHLHPIYLYVYQQLLYDYYHDYIDVLFVKRLLKVLIPCTPSRVLIPTQRCANHCYVCQMSPRPTRIPGQR